ncbi:MAG: activase, partial [Coprococcus sp.]
LDIVNNYHARMLSSAILAARNTHLEYVQIVSFGCGHDAYLSDEIIRLMKEISGKTPLILKLDESDIQGPLRIRVRSFVETITMRRDQNPDLIIHELEDPYPVKFTRESRKEKIVLVPNTSHAFCRIMSAAICTQHIKAEPLDIGREEAIRLGKQYVHNDICFPCQIVIGEALAALRSGKYNDREVAIGMGKYIGDCRLTHYSALLRKALDDAGYSHVPILTNDDVDYHNMHPGFRMSLGSAIRLAFALPVIDVLEELLRKIRPYEKVPGSTNQAFEEGMDAVVDGLQKHGVAGIRSGFKKAIELMKNVPYDRTNPRPKVLIVGEYLLNFHPGANHDIEDYLEHNGFEIIEARMADVIQKSYFYLDAQIKEYKLKKPWLKKTWLATVDKVFDMAHDMTDAIAKAHPLYTPACRMPDLVKASDPIIHHTFDAGEGVLIPGEILHHAKNGCRSFVILQPFGCLPNHVVGRGISKRLKELYPDAQILPLDYDPDVSFANIENRLQMLIMNAKSGNIKDKPAAD